MPGPLQDRDSDTPPMGCLAVSLVACAMWAVVLVSMLLGTA